MEHRNLFLLRFILFTTYTNSDLMGGISYMP